MGGRQLLKTQELEEEGAETLFGWNEANLTGFFFLFEAGFTE